MIIATSRSVDCLHVYIAHSDAAYRNGLSVDIGHTNRLIIDEDTWALIPQDQQDIIMAEACGFCSGWEAKENWKD